jgi:hypothetical protein
MPEEFSGAFVDAGEKNGAGAMTSNDVIRNQ